MFDSSLKTKMSLAVSLLMTVVISLLAFAAFCYFEKQLKNTISRQQFTLVSALAEEIDSKILNAQKELVAVAGNVNPILAVTPHAAQDFLDAQAGMRTVFDSGIVIFSRDGRLTAASPPERQLQGRNYIYRDYIRNTIATGKPQISLPFFSTQNHRHPIVMFTAPFFDSEGQIAGILAGAVDLMRDNLLGKLATIKIGENGYLYLYSTDRTMIVHPDRTRILRRDVPPGANRLFDQAIEGFEGTGETVNSRGLHAVSSFKHLKSTNWILAANFPQSEVYAPIYRAQWYLTAALIIVLFLSILTVWWFMRHLTAPLQLFTRHVREISVRGDEPQPIRVASRDEIGTLAQAFNEMITETKRMQEELIKAQKLESLGVLAGGIAHDFNNILTGILGNLSLANARLDPRHGIAKYLQDCEKAAVRASNLTRQLLTFARGGEPVKKVIEPASLITETTSFVLRGTNVRSIVKPAEDLWCLEADSGQLSQALHNILINAAQAMPHGGTVTVNAMNETLEPDNSLQLPPGHYVKIVVNDSGCGIPSENLARIFDPYFTTKPEGNGLGLASVYSIVKRHGGAVEVSSTVGAESSITIHLPALPGGRPEDEVTGNASAPAGSGRILIMDDEDFIRDIATAILEFMGYDVESCTEGGEAVELYRTALESDLPFDAVILDLTIPGGMGGKEAAALILGIDPGAVLIVSSGYSNDPVIANFRQHGFSGMVSKPFDAKGLARELGRLMQNDADQH